MNDEQDPGRQQRDVPSHEPPDGDHRLDGPVSGAHRADPVREQTAPDVETVLQAVSAARTQEVGRALAALLRRGDLVVLTGDLGAGKTTLAHGIGEGMDVRGDVTSPTFVIARVHPPLGEGPPLVHVDAYRLASLAEVDDLDLDASLSESVTVVEWGEGLVEDLAAARLEVRITRPRGGHGPDGPPADGDEPRELRFRAFGGRWRGIALPGAVVG
jgi:tRNA threonylcarbamoyladenosine biosynthesis protein TsaE